MSDEYGYPDGFDLECDDVTSLEDQIAEAREEIETCYELLAECKTQLLADCKAQLVTGPSVEVARLVRRIETRLLPPAGKSRKRGAS